MTLYKHITRETALERIDGQIKVAADRASEYTRLVIELRELRAFVAEVQKEVKQSTPDTVWMVASRSGGAPHYVAAGLDASFNTEWTCTCEAQKSGRECWAVKGVKEYELYNPSSIRATASFRFVDPKYNEHHTATRLRA